MTGKCDWCSTTTKLTKKPGHKADLNLCFYCCVIYNNARGEVLSKYIREGLDDEDRTAAKLANAFVAEIKEQPGTTMIIDNNKECPFRGNLESHVRCRHTFEDCRIVDGFWPGDCPLSNGTGILVTIAPTTN